MIEFNVSAMSCGHCAGAITKAIKAIDPAATVDVDLVAKTVKVESSQQRAALAGALAGAGYPPSPA
ncbi:MAG: heavy-metal-associated domain-containing protein [Burkholderiales bacterium]|nr:heavy-metal-associated domain-containing protein [Burkholderiales bacterium]